jgi:hypothetical protein
MTWPLSDRRERTFESEGHTLLLTRTPTNVKRARTAEVEDRSRDKSTQTPSTGEASPGRRCRAKQKCGRGSAGGVQINGVRRLRVAHPRNPARLILFVSHFSCLPSAVRPSCFSASQNPPDELDRRKRCRHTQTSLHQKPFV